MRKVLLVFCAVLAIPGLTEFARAQSTGVDFQPASSNVDNLGIRRYRLGPGDVLDIRVFGQSDLNGQYVVDEDGNISSLPFIDESIPAMCQNEKEIQKRITEAYSKYILKPRISVRIHERRSRPPAIVFGAVRLPSKVIVNRKLRLHEVLVTAGGHTQNANGAIDILHTEPEFCPDSDDPLNGSRGASSVAANDRKDSDVGKLETFKLTDLKGGVEENNPYVRPGDIIIVNEGQPAFITGMVVKPGDVIIKDQLTLTRAIAMAGGMQKMANTSQVHIYRKADGKLNPEPLRYDYDAIRKGKAPDVLLQAYDIIDVRPAGTFSAKSLGELLKGLGTGTLGQLPTRVFLPY